MKLWPFIAIPVLAVGGYFWLDDAFTGRTGYGDWPDGLTSEADFWNRGIFLGYKADRIRRVWTWCKAERVLGNSLQDKRHIYFASISIPADELEHHLEAWRADPFFHQHNDKILQTLPAEWPSWFPNPSKDNYVGSLVEEGGLISIYKKPDDDKLYLWFQG